MPVDAHHRCDLRCVIQPEPRGRARRQGPEEVEDHRRGTFTKPRHPAMMPGMALRTQVRRAPGSSWPQQVRNASRGFARWVTGVRVRARIAAVRYASGCFVLISSWSTERVVLVRRRVSACGWTGPHVDEACALIGVVPATATGEGMRLMSSTGPNDGRAPSRRSPQAGWCVRTSLEASYGRNRGPRWPRARPPRSRRGSHRPAPAVARARFGLAEPPIRDDGSSKSR